MNISKETTAQELSQIQGVSDQTRRAIGVNMSGGHVNAVEIVVKGYGAPTFDTLLSAFQAQLGNEGNPELSKLINKTQKFNRSDKTLMGSFEEIRLVEEHLDEDDDLLEAGAMEEYEYEVEE